MPLEKSHNNGLADMPATLGLATALVHVAGLAADRLPRFIDFNFAGQLLEEIAVLASQAGFAAAP